MRQYVVPETAKMSDNGLHTVSSRTCQRDTSMRLLTTASTLLILRPMLTQTALSLYGRNSRKARSHGMEETRHYWIRMKKMYGDNALYHLWTQVAEHYLPPTGSVWKCLLIWRLLIGLPYDSQIFGNFLAWGALTQLFFQVFRPEREAEYEYKCNISSNQETNVTGTNHQLLPEVLYHLPLHLTPLNSVIVPQTVLRSPAATRYWCCYKRSNLFTMSHYCHCCKAYL